MAFNKLRSKFAMLKLEDMFEKRVEEIRFRLKEKEKWRVFHAIRSFSDSYSKAKNYLIRLMARLDISTKQNAFRKW